MKINILAFGIARDIVNGSDMEITLPVDATVADLKELLDERYPDFGKLVSLRIAVNNEYAADDLKLSERDEVVLIPPVSGG